MSWKNQPRGSDGRWKAAGGSVGAAVVAGVVFFASGGAGGGGAAVESAASHSLKGKSSSKEAARKGNRAEAWKRLGLKSLKQTAKRDLKCVTASFSEVRDFFAHNPCRSLDRLLVAVADSHGNTVVVSVAWVKMPKADTTGKLKRIIDIQGSGDISPLASGALGLGGVDFTGHHYASRQSGSLLVVAETAPGGGHPGNELLDTVAEVAAEFPAP
ncbi:hypothetical protein [Amycolatopsis sp. NPDC059657]|uniref:hypothetical protein n=1 Tax=Amycolatopsis sp. NPDC059657 TaxID=3346899 RepID=UPI00366B5AA6